MSLVVCSSMNQVAPYSIVIERGRARRHWRLAVQFEQLKKNWEKKVFSR